MGTSSNLVRFWSAIARGCCFVLVTVKTGSSAYIMLFHGVPMFVVFCAKNLAKKDFFREYSVHCKCLFCAID